MKSLLAFLFISFLLPSISSAACTTEFAIDGAIGPATLDWVQRTKESAKASKCESILAMINTPGGNLQSTRLIVEEILNSEIPFLCLIGPSGAHAGSAGAIIMQACHVNGGMSATNIGAATPVSGSGEKLGEDMRNKMINDTRSWVVGLAKLRGRSEEFAKDIVEKGSALPSEEAKKKKAIDWAGAKKSDFLAFAEGKSVKLAEDETLKVVVGDLKVFVPDMRHKVMSMVTNPQIAYLMFMGSLGLLYFEITHPGMIVPGVLGAIGLGISLVAMHMMDVQTGGLLLIFLGVVLMILEIFVTSFGVLGAGGVVAFFLGSVFLFDPQTSGYDLPLSTILPTTVLLGMVMLGIAWLALSTRKLRNQADFGVLLGKEGHVTMLDESKKSGQIHVNGEIWKFKSKQELEMGDNVIVTKHKGFTLHVQPNKES